MVPVTGDRSVGLMIVSQLVTGSDKMVTGVGLVVFLMKLKFFKVSSDRSKMLIFVYLLKFA